jgi:hypothetical protein
MRIALLLAALIFLVAAMYAVDPILSVWAGAAAVVGTFLGAVRDMRPRALKLNLLRKSPVPESENDPETAGKKRD